MLPPQSAHWAKPVRRYFDSIAFTAGARPFSFPFVAHR